ncbi:hypothetical protein HMPREF9141_0392 [Prevotella multiformis DSM 16608]|uniref:Uncharacterized protein n=1 Tax=Prevotella multiformis DSM 16608 TaxID=888743 RepID=F0F476_9BACT|nr:hypothetical protein HMPREF9141_0392 [Prevotella multiformis DSM 16608]
MQVHKPFILFLSIHLTEEPEINRHSAKNNRRQSTKNAVTAMVLVG